MGVSASFAGRLSSREQERVSFFFFGYRTTRRAFPLFLIDRPSSARTDAMAADPATAPGSPILADRSDSPAVSVGEGREGGFHVPISVVGARILVPNAATPALRTPLLGLPPRIVGWQACSGPGADAQAVRSRAFLTLQAGKGMRRQDGPARDDSRGARGRLGRVCRRTCYTHNPSLPVAG